MPPQKQNLLDGLGKIDIPPPPTNLSRQVHRRLNERLLVSQLVDLAVRGIPYALFHFTKVLLAGLMFSLSGRYRETTTKPNPPQET